MVSRATLACCAISAMVVATKPLSQEQRRCRFEHAGTRCPTPRHLLTADTAYLLAPSANSGNQVERHYTTSWTPRAGARPRRRTAD